VELEFCGRRDAGDDLDLEIKARQPGGAYGRPVRVGRVSDHGVADLHDLVELVLRVGVKGRHIDHVLQRAACRRQDLDQIVEGESHLFGEVRLRRAVGQAADLAGYEEKVAGFDGGGVAVRLIEGVAACRENSLALGHGHFRAPTLRGEAPPFLVSDLVR